MALHKREEGGNNHGHLKRRGTTKRLRKKSVGRQGDVFCRFKEVLRTSGKGKKSFR